MVCLDDVPKGLGDHRDARNLRYHEDIASIPARLGHYQALSWADISTQSALVTPSLDLQTDPFGIRAGLARDDEFEVVGILIAQSRKSVHLEATGAPSRDPRLNQVLENGLARQNARPAEGYVT